MAAKSNINESKQKKSLLRSLLLAITIGIAGGLLLSGNILFWTGNTLVDNNKFAAITEPLIKQPAIQTAISKYGTDQLFSNIDVQGYISSVLPPKASFLAPTLTSQLKTGVNKQLLKSLANPKVQNIWNNSLTKSHDLVIKAATNYKGNGTIDLNQIFQFITKNLEGTKLGFLSGKQLPAKAGKIQIINATWLPTVHKIVVNIKPFEYIMTILFAGLVGLSILIAKNRRSIIIKMGILFSLLMLVTIVSLRLAKVIIGGNVQQDYSNAATTAYSIIVKPFYIQTITIMTLGIVISLVAWLSGDYKSAVKVKKMISSIFSGNLHKLLFKQENKVTKFVGAHKTTLNWIVVSLAGIMLCFVGISLSILLSYALVIILVILSLEVISSER